MLKAAMGGRLALAAGLLVSPDGDIAFIVEDWIPAVVTSVEKHTGNYEPWYQVVVTDADGYTYYMDDVDADYAAEYGLNIAGQDLQISVDDGYIEQIRKK